LIGQTFENKFRIIRLIGRGGMGEVFEAEHTTLQSRVAIKLMLEKYNGDNEAVARFQREALAASRIGSQNIIRVMDTGTAPDGRAYVVMELLEGQPLSKLLEEVGPLPPNRGLRIMRQVLRAVGAAHAKGIVHRDLKPDNIFLISNGEQEDFVKLLDFGISKIVDPDLGAAATKLTTTGVVMGTPLYMAPEQAMGNEIDHHADIYACGVIFYEMLAGQPPFVGQTYAVLVAKMLTTEPPLLNTVREGLPPKTIAAIHRALEKEPTARHASAEAFLAALPTASSASAPELASTVVSGEQPQALVVRVQGTGPNPAPAPAPVKRSNAALYGGAVFAGVVVVAIAMLVTSRNNTALTPPKETVAKTDTPKVEPPKTEPLKTEPSKTEPKQPTITPIEERTGFDFTASPADVVITVDNDRTLYHSANQINVTPGSHELHATLEGYVPQSRTIVVAQGKTEPVEFTLVPVKKAVVGVGGAKIPHGTGPTQLVKKSDDGYTAPKAINEPKQAPTPKDTKPPIDNTPAPKKDNPYLQK
jgi:serine/threonine-protein kinase